MAEETKRSGGAVFPKPSSDDRKSLAASPAAAAKKVIIKSADMKEDMQKEAVDCALSAFENHSVEKDIAEYIKKEFDKKHGATWHCIVGRNFELSNWRNSIALKDCLWKLQLQDLDQMILLGIEFNCVQNVGTWTVF